MSPQGAARPQLSVLVFTRNDAAHLQACLQSLVEEPPSCSFEVRVFDNASEDRSLEVLSTFAEQLPLSWVAAEIETSFSIGNNRLLELAAGELVLFLNPDTRPSGAALDACASLVRSLPEVGLVSPRLVYPDGTHQGTGWHLPGPGRLLVEHTGLGQREVPPAPSGITDVGWLMGCFLMGRRELLRSLGGFDESFWFHGTDLELCARVIASGARVLRVEGEVLVHTGHKSWDRERREASQQALTQWLRRDHGPLAAEGVRLAARWAEVVR
jgi:GT2 family glycosyltransferase